MRKVKLYYIGMEISFNVDDIDYIIKQFKKREDITFEQPDGKICIHKTKEAISMEIMK